MAPKDYLKWYLRSPLGIGDVVAGIAGILIAAAAGLPLGLALLLGSGIVALVGFIALFSGFGPRFALAAMDASIGREREKKLALAEAARERLSRIRLAEGRTAEAARLVALAAGEYLESCKRSGADDPIADAAIDEALEILGIFLKEKDETATEKRFGLEDKDPFADAEDRVVAALKGKAALLRERRIGIDGGLPAAQSMSVREEIE